MTKPSEKALKIAREIQEGFFTGPYFDVAGRAEWLYGLAGRERFNGVEAVAVQFEKTAAILETQATRNSILESALNSIANCQSSVSRSAIREAASDALKRAGAGTRSMGDQSLFVQLAAAKQPMPEDVAGLCKRLRAEQRGEFDLLMDRFETKIINPDGHDAAAALEAQAAENARLRKIISDCAVALGNGAFLWPDCSIEFCENLPSEIGLHVASLREDRNTWKEKCAEGNAEIARLKEALAVTREALIDAASTAISFAEHIKIGTVWNDALHIIDARTREITKAALTSMKETE